MMNLPEGTHLAYTVMNDGWASYAAIPASSIASRPLLIVSASADGSNGQASEWEFGVEEPDAGDPCLRLDMFAESWVAFRQIPGFFAFLAERGIDATMKDVIAKLVEMGAVDETPRAEELGG